MNLGSAEHLMSTVLPIGVLLTPLVIAATAIATMAVLKSARTPRRLSAELGYSPDPGSSLSLTVARYVGGHPSAASPLAGPFLLLTTRHMAVFARRWGAKVFLIAWPKVEQVTLLDRAQMEMSIGSVRGLAPGALEASDPESRFLRVRFEDDRGWWQNVVFELCPTDCEEQTAAIERFWDTYRTSIDTSADGGTATPQTSPG
jgi:hypothetical protein